MNIYDSHRLCKMISWFNRRPEDRTRSRRCTRSAGRKACFFRGEKSGKSVSYLKSGDEKGKPWGQGVGGGEGGIRVTRVRRMARRHSREQTIKIVKNRAQTRTPIPMIYLDDTGDLWKSRCVFYQTHSTVVPSPRFKRPKENCVWKLLERNLDADGAVVRDFV